MSPLMTEGRQLHCTVLTTDDISAINLASLEILERTGIFVELAGAREMLRGAGARVEGERVRIPSFLVQKALGSAPSRVTLFNRDGKRTMFLEGNRSYYFGVGDCPKVLDPYTRQVRDFMSKDYGLTARLVDACPNIWGVGCGGNAHDYPAEVRAQVAFKYSMLNTKKLYSCHALDAQQMMDIYDMAEAIAGGAERLQQAPFLVTTAEPTTPLSLFKDATEILLQAAERNLPLVWYPMPSACTTAPATPAGTIAIGNAEVLAGLVLHQLARPGAPFIYGSMPEMTDMRSTQVAYGSPDLTLGVAASTDLAHSYRLPMFGTTGCTDAWDVDEQAAAEVTMHSLMSQLSGANLIHDTGIIAGGIAVSPELILLTNEIADMVDHATRRIDTSQEELCLDLIDRVGPQGNYLALDHTLANFRRFWHSDIFLRNRLTGTDEDEQETVRQRINRKTKEIIEKHEVEPLPGDTIKALNELEEKWMARTRSLSAS
jgi:trimethylamine---corrinoid protein Co-methyltransferase